MIMDSWIYIKVHVKEVNIKNRVYNYYRDYLIKTNKQTNKKKNRNKNNFEGGRNISYASTNDLNIFT